jgi:hypothetical protein
MVFVAIAALNCGVIRACYYDLLTYKPGNANRLEFLALGALPMANVLAVGIVIGYRRRECRPFLLGFEACGAAALVLYLAYIAVWSFYDYQWPVRPWVFMVLNPFGKSSATSNLPPSTRPATDPSLWSWWARHNWPSPCLVASCLVSYSRAISPPTIHGNRDSASVLNPRMLRSTRIPRQ